MLRADSNSVGASATTSALVPAPETAPAPALPPALASDPMDGALLRSLQRCWLPAVGLGLLGAVLAVTAVWFVMPSKYTAQALLHVASRPPRGVFSSNEGGADDFAAFQRTQAALVKSRSVLQAALRQPAVAELSEVRSEDDPVAWLTQNLTTDTLLGPEILRVSMSDTNPQMLPVVVNAVVDAYLKEVVNADRIKQQGRMEELLENFRRVEDSLRRKRGTLKELEASLGVEDPQILVARFQAALNQLSVLQKDLVQTRVGIQNAKAELAVEQARLQQPPQVTVSELAIDQYLRQDPAYQKLEERVAEIEGEIATIKLIGTAGVRNSQLEGPMKQLAGAQAAVAARRKDVRPQVEALLAAKALDDLKENIAKLQSRLAVLGVQETGLEAEVKRLEAEVKQLSAVIRQPDKPTSDLAALRDEVAQTELVLKKLSEQLYTLRVEPVVPPRVRLLESAEVPQTKTLDRKIKVAGLAGLGMFGLVVFGFSWREYRARRVYEVEDVPQGLGLSLLGTLPALPVAARRVPLGAAPGPHLFWQALLAESVDAIRTRLLHAAEAGSLRVVMVTSAVGGEGKTSLASHLAASLARARRKVLLIDGDLRNPGVHRQFNLPGTPGFAEVLRGERQFGDVIDKTPVNRLDVVPAGQWESEAIQAFAQRGAGTVFDPLKDQYDFIILDSSPVLPVADALLMGRHVDGVIFAVLREVSRQPAVFAGHKRLTTLGIRVLGTVVIGASADENNLKYPYSKVAG